MKIKRIVPNICTNKLKESRAFYEDFLGLKLVMDMNVVMTFASHQNATAQITIIYEDQFQESNADISITIEVVDIDAVYEKALLSDYDIVYPLKEEPWGVRRFFVLDPNGVTINLMSHLYSK